MIDEHDFLELDERKDQFAKRKIRQKGGVIKKARNNIQGTLHLDPMDEDSEDGVDFFQPIYEGDLIVGVIHKCICGKTAELRFQYSDK
ncbi:MAG: hypothetical protein L3J79_05610 [Candidatus Marinimicrobia bacterium]|nr:hypothetical protein [Candidatus Neomarinimicrobiota bacterium]